MRSISIAGIIAIVTISAAAEEKPVHLKQASGLDKVEANCGICHSLDYVQMNSPFLDVAGWDAEVTKMINAFGAPIEQADAKIITEYLKNNYGAAPESSNVHSDSDHRVRTGPTEARKTSGQMSDLRRPGRPVKPTITRKTPAQMSSGKSNTSQESKSLGHMITSRLNRMFGQAGYAHPNRPAYAHPDECWTEDSGFRWTPCHALGGGDGGGGGAGGGGGGGGGGSGE